jgi:hypothetical protein
MSFAILLFYLLSFLNPLSDDEKLYLLVPTFPIFSRKFEVEFDRNNELDDGGDDDNEVSRKFEEEL